MNADINLVVTDLSNQVANLSREKAIFFALATQKEQENQQLSQELEDTKRTLEQLKNELLKEKAKTAGPVPVKYEGDDK